MSQAAAAKVRAFVEQKDVDGLIQRHLPLVRRLAWHVHGRISSSAELEELIQIGMVALVEAAHAFEDRGFEFSTYASIRIKGSMIDHLRRISGRSRSASSSRRAIEAVRVELEQENRGAPTVPQIAKRMNVPLAAYYAMEGDSMSLSHESIDEAYSDSDLTFSAPDEMQDEILDREALSGRLRDAIMTLDQRSQMVLQLYFFEEMNLEEIGLTMDIGAARVCQIKKAALTKLQTGLGASLDWA
ncbi:MAG: FliA/WhiG family RNA polymerase sigma factor [Sphingomonadales bacterium]